MNIIDTIRQEEHTVRWTGEDHEGRTFQAWFGFLDTQEQYDAYSEGISSNDPEWEGFDSRIFYWVSTLHNEDIAMLTDADNPYMDFIVIPESEEVNG